MTAFTLLWIFVFIFPAVVVQGANPVAGSRSLQAFMTSYIDFFVSHQLSAMQIRNSVVATPTIQQQIFPDAQTFQDVIRIYPGLYFDFLGVSVSRSIPLVVDALKLMLIPLAIVMAYNRRLGPLRPYLFVLVIATVLTILPAQLIAFVRIRYFAKLLPAIMVISTAGCLQLSTKSRRIGFILWTCGLISIAWEAFYFNDMRLYSPHK